VGSEILTAQLTLQIPPGVSVPLPAASQVSVVLVDSGGTDVPNRGLVLREAGTGRLLLAADMARGGPVLTAADTSPFALSSGTVPVGCRQDGCGKLLYFPRTLDAGVAGASLEPGARATLVVPPGTYTLLSVTDSAYAGTTTCGVAEARPWMLWRTAAP
jgi:hypothetical protein